MKHATQSFIKASRHICDSRRNQSLHRTLLELKKDTSIKICFYDKGNGVLIVNSDEYYDKLNEIVLDRSKFTEVKVNPKLAHPIIRNENKIKNYLAKHVKDCISKSEYEFIVPSGSQPGKLYGLGKVHKPNIPFRPVVSMICTAEYNLGKYLDKCIKRHIPSKFMLDSTSSFLDRISNFVFKPSDVLISFDVVSLFTNVPLKETISEIAEIVYKSDSPPTFGKDVFIRLMEFATSGMFLYNDRLYKQTDGVTMGSPLGPTLANFCLGILESKMFENGLNGPDSSQYPALYLRYVDDIFCVFREGVPYQAFLDKLNDLHPNLKFTYELGPKMLPFLDTCISLPTSSTDSFTSKIFRKSSYTSLILNFSAMCPQKWKFGLIQCLLHRAYMISSSWDIFHKEVEFLKNLFIRNGYPVKTFYTCLRRFVNNKFKKDTKTKIVDDKVETMFFIPYIGMSSVIYGRKIREILKSNYCVDVRIVFTSFKVRNYFSLKSRTPSSLLSNVVYKFQCLCDTDQVYIGKTKRHLTVRVREHGNSRSAIFDHLQLCSRCKDNFSCNRFKILDRGRDDFETTIKEALYIKNSRPKLNKQLYTQGSSFILSVF